MKLLSKNELKELFKSKQNGGVVFSDCDIGQVYISDGDFGARSLSIKYMDDELFDFDWNIEEYKDTDVFYVYEKIEIEKLISELNDTLKLF